MNKKYYLQSVLRVVFMGVLSFLFLIPFYIILRNAFATDRMIIGRKWMLWPWPMHILDNLKELFANEDVNIFTGLRNSAFIAVTQTFFQLLFASLAGYALARIPFRWSKQVFAFIIATLMIPYTVTFIPTYIVVAKLQMVNTFAGIILPGLFSTFAAFMYRQFFLDFPIEIEEAGKLEGLGYFGLWSRLALPNARGISIALGVIAFMRSWNAFLWPLVIGQNSSMWTIQVVISVFLTSQTIIIHEIFLGSLVALIPVTVLFFVLQRFIVQGITMSGVKG
ncbi:MAG: carbohydrate ABC transporter permease [Spirochaetes bacterium]|nr:carbohydrate ABC transporter permease [Spirochaetota bacterium]